MAAVTSTVMTVEEFSRLPADGARHEMNAGELITLPPPKSLHSRVARSVFTALDAVLQKEGLREVYQEAGYVLSHEPLTIRQPDASVLSKARVEATPEDSYFEGAPELAVEIVSPSDVPEDLEVKIRQYLNAGAKQVWVLHPKTRDAHVWTLTGSVVLKDRDLLPGFEIRVSAFFDRRE